LRAAQRRFGRHRQSSHRRSLEFEWNPAENEHLGLWLTSRGWHNHPSFCHRTTNANDDSLAVATARIHVARFAGNSWSHGSFPYGSGFDLSKMNRSRQPSFPEGFCEGFVHSIGDQINMKRHFIHCLALSL